MLYYNLKLSILLIILLHAACTPKDNLLLQYDSFPKKVAIKGTIVNTEDKYRGGFLNICDSILLLTNTPNNKYVIHLYNKNNFEKLSHSGITGRGPNEISNPLLGVLDKNNKCVWIPDYGTKKFLKFEIDSIIKNQKYLPESDIAFPDSLIPIFYLPFKDSIFSTTSFQSDELITFFNYNGQIIDSLIIYNNINLYESEGFISNPRELVNYFTYTIHPNCMRIALGYSYSDHMIIIDSGGKIINKTYGPNNIFQLPDPGNPNRIVTNSFIKSNDRFIFCLYNGKRKFDKKTNSIPSFANHIHIFDWNGIPVANVELDYDAMSFTIDLELNRIITFSPEANSIVYYNFNIESLYE